MTGTWPGASDAPTLTPPSFRVRKGAWIGFVTGLQAETRIAAHMGPALAGGGTPAGAEAAARRLAASGAAALVSFGVAGGLDPALAPGSLVIAGEILDDGLRYLCDPALASRWGTPAGRLLASPGAITTAADKARAFAATGALAVDTESGAVARVARDYGLPFAAVRAICDPAGRTLPPAALVALNARGRIAPLRLLVSLACDPGQIPAMITLGRDAAAAHRTLRALG